jgi:hypothetical protein
MRFYLLTTASGVSAVDGTLNRFLTSALVTSSAHVFCVARGWSSQSLRQVVAQHGSRQLTLVESPAGISLSEARNRALGAVASSAVDPDDVVAFPDDDCWYYSDTLTRVADAFATQPNVAAISGVYGPSPLRIDPKRFPSDSGILNRRSAVQRASSVTIFLRWEAALELGGFNPLLGAGTKLQGGEDTDYVLRLLESGRDLAYRPEVIVGHEYTMSTSKSYAASYVVVLASHLSQSPVLFPSLVRGLLGSLRVRARLDGSPALHAFGHLRPAMIRALAGERSHLEIMSDSDNRARPG